MLENEDKKVLSDDHGRKISYKSSDKKVAIVSKSGKITAVGKGTCKIYVCAIDGKEKKIRVKVE